MHGVGEDADSRGCEPMDSDRIRVLEFAEVAGRLPDGASEEDWLLLRGNLERISDFSEWHQVIAGDIAPPSLTGDERGLVAKAAEFAATLDWSNDPWHALADALKSSTGQRGRALFHPLRLALTGRDSGPEMAGLLRRIGKERALVRLSAAAND